MYQVDDIVIYGGYGACRITATGVREVAGTPTDRDYYAITPLGESSVIFTPAEGGKIPMRDVMSETEARALLSSLPEMEPLQLDNYKEREKACRAIVRGVDSQALARLLKTLQLCRSHAASHSKKPSYIDERYIRQVEDILVGELSLALHTTREAISSYLSAIVPKNI